MDSIQHNFPREWWHKNYDAGCAPFSTRQHKEWRVSAISGDDWRDRSPPTKAAVVRNFPDRDNAQALEATLEEACNRLNGLQDNWDDDGAKAIDLTTINRATNFVRGIFAAIRSRRSIDVLPQITPTPDGSIDILLRNDRFELLLNIPPAGTPEGDFFGRTPSGFEIKGAFVPERHMTSALDLLIENG